MSLRLIADNVLIILEPPESETARGLHLVDLKKPGHRSRFARVVAVGPGYHKPSGAFIPTPVKPGDRVITGELAGEAPQDYRLDKYIPRHNTGTKFSEWANERGEYRIVRFDELDAVLEQESA